MNKPPLQFAGRLTAIALVIAAAGFLLEIVSGAAKVPLIPPGLPLLLVPAALIAFVRGRWTLVLGIVVALFLTFGLFASGSALRLLNPSQVGGFIGTWIQFVAQIVAGVSGVLAVVQDSRSRT